FQRIHTASLARPTRPRAHLIAGCTGGVHNRPLLSSRVRDHMSAVPLGGHMNPKTIGYWLLTALVALPNLGSGLAYLTEAEPMVAAAEHLGLSMRFMKVLGTWKVLGALALLAPFTPKRLREWAHAGYVFTFTGAATMHLAVGDGLGGAGAPLVFLGLLAGA